MAKGDIIVYAPEPYKIELIAIGEKDWEGTPDEEIAMLRQGAIQFRDLKRDQAANIGGIAYLVYPVDDLDAPGVYEEAETAAVKMGLQYIPPEDIARHKAAGAASMMAVIAAHKREQTGQPFANAPA